MKLKIYKEVDNGIYQYFYEENDIKKAYIKGRIFDVNTISLISVEGEERALKAIGIKFVLDCKENDLEIMIPNREDRQKEIEWMREQYFKVKHKKKLYYQDISDFVSDYYYDFELCEMDIVGDDVFKLTMADCTKGDPLLEDEILNAEVEFEILKLDPNFKEEHCQLVVYEDEMIGFFIASIDHHSISEKVEGSLKSFGIYEQFRGKGIGQKLHDRATYYLKQNRVTDYYGSCSSKNTPMIKIFENNGFDLVEEQYFFIST